MVHYAQLPPQRSLHEASFQRSRPSTKIDAGSRVDLLITLQRSAGNAAVAGLLQSRGASRSNQSVQRCGPVPRECSDEERSQHSTESDNRVQAVTLQRGPHDDIGDSGEEDPPPGGLSDEPPAEVPAGPIDDRPSGASEGGDAGVPGVDAGSDKPAPAGHDNPRPVGFGQDQPETYEPDFMKDALPDVGKVLRALASRGGWMTIYHVAKEASQKDSLSDVLQVIIAGGLFGTLLRDDDFAEIVPQSWLIFLAQREVSLAGPLARQHLDHYLAGTGSDFVEDIAKLYGDDAGFKLQSELKIHNAGELTGQFKIGQEAYFKPEWKYSLGAVDEVHYTVQKAVDDTDAEVLIRLRDNYEWHPDEYRTWGSHIAHVALEKAKQNGAKNFWEVGEATVRLFVGKKLLKKLGAGPRT